MLFLVGSEGSDPSSGAGGQSIVMKSGESKESAKSRIAVELVPRDAVVLGQELQEVRDKFPVVSLINIPDLPRFDLRSWDGCILAKKLFSHAVPHIRAVDFDLKNPLPMVELLTEAGIDEVLV